MAARNKRPKRAKPADIDPRPDVRHIFALHVEGSARRDELLEQVRQLKAAGKIREARTMLAHAENIQRSLHALENECQVRRPNHSDRGS